jgi:uncharacterized damage-inducible protein DinB
MSSNASSVTGVGISFADLLRYEETETTRWRGWLEKQPADVLDLPFGDPARHMGTVREMLWHIFITEWVYGCVLNGKPFDAWDQFRKETVDDLFAIQREAHRLLSAYLATASEDDMTTRQTLSARGTTIEGSARKFLTHTFLHSLRHWAQIATVLRQNGHQTDWQHDYVLCDAME